MSAFLERDISQTKLGALRHSLQTADQIISGLPIKLEFDNDLSYPELTLGNTIKLKVRTRDNPSDHKWMASLLGANYHGLAHAMYSTFSYMEIWNLYIESIGKTSKTAIHARFHDAYMILEDARIETIIGAKYNRMRKYFSAAVAQYLIADPEQWKVGFLLTYGRKYLSKKVRDEFEEAFIDQNYSQMKQYMINRRIAKYKELTDRYRLLALTTRSTVEEAGEILLKYAELLLADNISMKPPHEDSQPSQNATQSRGRKNHQEDAEQARKEEEDDGEGLDGNDLENGDGGEDQSSKPEDGSGRGKDQKHEEGGEGDGGSEPSDGSGEEDGGSDAREAQEPPQGGGSGVGNQKADNQSTPSSSATGDILQTLKDIVEDFLDDKEIQEEVRGFQEAMEDTSSGLGSNLSQLRWGSRQVSPEMVLRSDALANELRKVWARMEPGWEYDLPDGNRIDMQRAALAVEPEDYETIYVDWNPGQQENSGMEAVILGDRSSSMGSRIGQFTQDTLSDVASVGIWQLLRALRELEAYATVLSFEYGCNTLYDRDEEVRLDKYRVLGANGGTSPLVAVREARRILSNSEQPNKLLVMFTDGQWPKDQEIISSLSSMPDVTKVLVLIGDASHFNTNAGWYDYRKLFDVVENVSNGDIFTPMSRAVVKIMERNIA